MKLDLLTNAIVVDDAIRFVAERSKQYLHVCSSLKKTLYPNLPKEYELS